MTTSPKRPGRPPLHSTPMVSMTVQVRESVKRKLEEMAEKRGVSLADLVRDVLGAGILQMRD